MSESQNNTGFYSTSPVQPTASTASQPHLTTGEWIITLLLLSVPLLNLILLFVWAFSKDTHPAKRNYSRATLIIAAIFIGLAFAFGLLIPLSSALAAQQ